MGKTKLKKYQRQGVKKLHKFNGRALLADEMGLGKSLQALKFAEEADSKLVIIVCPATIKWSWEQEALKHFGWNSHVIEGRTPPENAKFHRRIIIINYDILRDWIPILKEMKPSMVIVDECHKVANRGTQQFKNTKRLCRGIKHVICISGTPLTNRPAELFASLTIIRSDLYPSFFAFAERFCSPQLKPWGWEYKGAENLDELHRELQANCMIRRLKIDVLPDLPAKTRSIIPLEICNRKEYERAVKDFVGWLRQNTSAGTAKRAERAEKLVKVGYLKRLAAKLKLRAVIGWVKEFLQDSDEKLILFGIHKSVLSELEAEFREITVLVDGSVTGKNRKAAILEFNNPTSKKRLFLGNIKAAGVGWSCPSASTVAFCELSWTPGEHTQAEDRVHGIGRGVDGIKSQAIYLIGRNTIEEDICRIIQEKQFVLDEALDGGTRSDDSLNVFDQLLMIIGKDLK